MEFQRCDAGRENAQSPQFFSFDCASVRVIVEEDRETRGEGLVSDEEVTSDRNGGASLCKAL